MPFDEYLLETMGEVKVENLPEGRVPQTTFWILDNNRTVGMLKAQQPTQDGLDTINQYWIELGG